MDCSPARLLRPWGSPGKNTGVGCRALLQGIFPTLASNPGVLHRRQILHHLNHNLGFGRCYHSHIQKCLPRCVWSTEYEVQAMCPSAHSLGSKVRYTHCVFKCGKRERNCIYVMETFLNAQSEKVTTGDVCSMQGKASACVGECC